MPNNTINIPDTYAAANNLAAYFNDNQVNISPSMVLKRFPVQRDLRSVERVMYKAKFYFQRLKEDQTSFTEADMALYKRYVFLEKLRLKLQFTARYQRELTERERSDLSRAREAAAELREGMKSKDQSDIFLELKQMTSEKTAIMKHATYMNKLKLEVMRNVEAKGGIVMVTLTVSPQDYMKVFYSDQASKLFGKMMRKLKAKAGNVPYFCVPERGSKGDRWHYHIMLFLPAVCGWMSDPSFKLYDAAKENIDGFESIWPHGFVHAKAIRVAGDAFTIAGWSWPSRLLKGGQIDLAKASPIAAATYPTKYILEALTYKGESPLRVCHSRRFGLSEFDADFQGAPDGVLIALSRASQHEITSAFGSLVHEAARETLHDRIGGELHLLPRLVDIMPRGQNMFSVMRDRLEGNHLTLETLPSCFDVDSPANRDETMAAHYLNGLYDRYCQVFGHAAYAGAPAMRQAPRFGGPRSSERR